MLFALLFVFFIVLNGRFTTETVLVGLLVCALAELLACKVLGWNREKSIRTLRILPDILRYVGRLLREIMQANIAVLKIILSPRMEEMNPVLYEFDSHLENEISRTVLANSITITPGTYTVKTQGERLLVHCLGDRFIFDDMELCFNVKLVEMEAKEEADRD